jgi:hypothetical protein
MDDSRLTKTYLDSLTTDELVKMADRFGLDIPPNLERPFIIGELLDTAGDEGGEAAAEAPLAAPGNFPETAELPKQYNITFLEVMIRDPLWAFVFWEIKGHDKDIHERAPDFGGYCLRVIPLGEKPADKNREHRFTVPVGMNDTAWYLSFPPAEGRYQVELCVLREEGEQVLAVSRPFMLPRLLSRPQISPGAGFPGGIEDVYHNPLALLSGAGDFPVIRNAERLSRILGNGAPVQAG